MGAIFKKELRSFFTSPIGYVLLAVVAFFAGLFFLNFNIVSYSADMSYVYFYLFMVIVLVLPLVTMRLFSDEKRQKTDQALLTSPVNLTSIVLGKFFAAFLMLVFSLLVTLIFAVIIAFQVTPDWAVIIGNFIGLLLIGGMIISIGLLISSSTESQLIAALATIGVSLVILLMDIVSSQFSGITWLVTIIDFLSVSTRYSSLSSGVVAYDDIIYFISMQALFLFLTVRVLDHKRWS